jgi:DNA-binding MarR family transcriptional regulator
MTRRDPNSHLAAEIRRGVTHLSRRLRAERSADALSANKLLVLSHLYPNQECSPGEIASGEHLQPQSLSKLLAELESDGLIVRSKSPADGRQSVLKITPKGRSALQHDMSERDLWLASALQHFSETELQLLHITARILERLADFDMSPSQAQELKPTISKII